MWTTRPSSSVVALCPNRAKLHPGSPPPIPNRWLAAYAETPERTSQSHTGFVSRSGFSAPSRGDRQILNNSGVTSEPGAISGVPLSLNSSHRCEVAEQLLGVHRFDEMHVEARLERALLIG